MSNNRGRGREEEEEVEELLRAAQDDMLLKLTLNTHLSHTSTFPLDQDLLHRFQSLKAKTPSPAPPPIAIMPTPKPIQQEQSVKPHSGSVDDELEKVLGADLSARFYALKGSSSSGSTQVNLHSEGLYGVGEGKDEVDEDDEVSKLMQWAMDAARLDPSKTDDDDDDDDDSGDETEEEDDSDDVNDKKRKPRKK